MKLHLLTGCQVGPTPDVAAHDFVLFGNHFFDGQMQIRHRFVHADHHLLVPLCICGLAAGSIVVLEAGSHVFVDYRRISLVDEIFEMTSHELLHLVWR